MPLTDKPTQHITLPLSPGVLKITINSCFLNVEVKRPYVIITLGDQTFKTSISEYSQGSWNEGFELKITYHNQLFDTIQLDLYDNYAIFPDKHVGRAEIRLKNLKGMPETFTSYYEVMEKRLSTSATSIASKKAMMTCGVGAIQAEISYHYQSSQEEMGRRLSLDISEMNRLVEQQTRAMNNDRNLDRSYSQLSDRELIDAFNRHLKSENESNSRDIKFTKYEQGDHQVDHPDDTDDTDDTNVYTTQTVKTVSRSVKPLSRSIKEPLNFSIARVDSMKDVSVDNQPEDDHEKSNMMKSVTSIFKFTNRSESVSSVVENTLETEDDSLKAYPILDTIGSWTMAKDTNQVFRAIGKLLVAFGQGFELSNLQILSGFKVVERFYNDLPRDRTWDMVENEEEIEVASYMWKYAMASYGWKGLNFIGKGNGLFSDAIRSQSDALSICEHLQINKEELLAYEFRSEAAFRPSYFIARDRKVNAIVLSIRGTMSTFDTMTDLVCEYEPWKGGLVHKGMKSSANWFFKNIAPKLIAYINKHSTKLLYIVGHSLGASTAAILTMMLQDYINEYNEEKDRFKVYCFGYAPACGVSLDLAEMYKDQIQSFVFADDFVSKLSYGSMMDVKELIIAGSEAAQSMGLGKLIWGKEVDDNAWKSALKRIAECRKRCLEDLSNPRLYVAGTVYQFWLDPIPKNDTRIVIERTSPERVSTELIIRMSIILDHLPTNFDLAFHRALEGLNKKSDKHLKLEDTHTGIKNDIIESIAEIGIKGTTERGGGEGQLLDENDADHRR
ncbi:hypothetical protein BDB01DRAFT_832918 [Pilobolus umbonatus]|nr:hypothetical protein BDB01DRAFT_832918 [Pilobolus umbonatus]